MKAVLVLSSLALPALAGPLAPLLPSSGDEPAMPQSETIAEVRLVVGDADGCAAVIEKIRDEIRIGLPGLDAELGAGVPYDFTVELAKKAAWDAAQWRQEFSSLHLLAETQTPYPTGMRLDGDGSAMLDFLYADEVQATFPFQVTPRPTFGGDFTLSLRFVLVTPEFRYCIVDAVLERGLVILSDELDVTPPLVRKLRFDRREYLAGDTAKATVTFSEPLRELTTDHIELTNPLVPVGEPGHGFPGYLPDGVYTFAQSEEPNTYVITFEVASDAVPGDYFLAWLNRFDAAGNFEDEVGGVDEEEMTVALASPLRVVSSR